MLEEMCTELQDCEGEVKALQALLLLWKGKGEDEVMGRAPIRG